MSAVFLFVFVVRGKDCDNGKSFISFWIATGLQRAPRNDDQNHDYDYDK
jgi:hypothetical protein